MVGCTPQLQPDLETHPLWQVLQCLGAGKISLIGEIGTAAAVKLSLNQLIASLTVREAGQICLSLDLLLRLSQQEPAFFCPLAALSAPGFLDKPVEQASKQASREAQPVVVNLHRDPFSSPTVGSDSCLMTVVPDAEIKPSRLLLCMPQGGKTHIFCRPTDHVPDASHA